MTKIMLVEDDNNLREIYEARLLAEGYEIVSAKDGEEALAMAVKEKPELIISDVMMPKISGFDMLDILRSTPETKNTKVIMMTALSQAEDKARADKLGADRYLVKSQVTLEDVAKVAREVLDGDSPPPPAVSPTIPQPASPDPTIASDQTPTVYAPTPGTVTPQATAGDQSATAFPPADTISTQPDDSVPTAAPTTDDISVAKDLGSAPESPTVTTTVATEPIQPPLSQSIPIQSPSADATEALPQTPPAADPTPQPTTEPQPRTPLSTELAAAVNQIIRSNEPATEVPPEAPKPQGDDAPVSNKKIISPINDMTQKSPDLSTLLAQEEQKVADSSVQTDSNLEPASVVQPGGITVTPATSATSSDPTQPGNVVHPAPEDPTAVAL